MKDKSWLLNPAAIAAAKSCIQAIEAELGVKLKLSHPQFLEMIEEYCELTDSTHLNESYQALKAFSQGVAGMTSAKLKVVEIKRSETVNIESGASSLNQEKVTYKGRDYPRFDESGNEFKGLYRGQARYA